MQQHFSQLKSLITLGKKAGSSATQFVTQFSNTVSSLGTQQEGIHLLHHAARQTSSLWPKHK